MEKNTNEEQLGKTYEQMYTRFVINPIAVPAARWLARYRWITPNRITYVSGLTGLGAAACFFFGLLPLGGVLFLLRFFIDCLDGKVARAQGTSSERGAALDLTMDVAGILLCAAALGWHLSEVGALHPLVALGFLVFIGVFNWLLQYRKQLAERHGLGSGGADRNRTTNIPVLRGYLRWCQRVQMNPVPYAVEMETLALGILPLFASVAAASWGVILGVVFYFLACLVNFLRIWRIAGRVDRTRMTNGEQNV